MPWVFVIDYTGKKLPQGYITYEEEEEEIFIYTGYIGVSRGGGGQGVLTPPFPGPPFSSVTPPFHPTRSHRQM